MEYLDRRLIALITCLMLMCPVCAWGAVSLPWSTTYDCAETQWGQPGWPGCSGLSNGLDDQTDGKGEQITSAANFPGGGGGRGQRHWENDGVNQQSGGTSLYFTSPQKELWIRWYMRYEAGFKWSSLSYDKWLYINTGTKGKDCIPEFHGNNGISLIAQGSPDYYQVSTDTRGWQSIYGSQSDGSWFCVEIHIKMDTNGSDGIGRLWLNGELIASNTAVNWSGGDTTARRGWTRFLIGSNQKSPSNGRAMYVDFDDIVVQSTTPSGRDASGNPMIGPLDYTPEDPTCETNPELCADQAECEDAGWYWCDGACQAEECGEDPTPPDSGVLFEEGFNDNSFSTRGWFDDTSVSLDSSVKYSGNSSLKLTWNGGSTAPTGIGAMRKTFEPTDELYTRHYMRLNSDWVGSGKSYHPHMLYVMSDADSEWSGLANNYLQTYIELLNRTPQLCIQDARNISTLYGSPPIDLTQITENRAVGGCNGCLAGSDCGDVNTCYNTGSYWYNGNSYQGPTNTYDLNTWHKVETYFKMNTVSGGKAQADGIMRMWVDDDLVINKTNIVWRTAQRPNLKWRTFVIAPYIGDGSPQTQTMWIDDLVLASGGPSEPPPEEPPPQGDATCLWYESFDDGDLDLPSWGNLRVYTRYGIGTPPNCPAYTPGQYIMSRTGYGGTGKCFSNPAVPADGASKDPYIRIYPYSWPYDGFYTSFRIRIVDAGYDSYQNLKLVYPHWNGTNGYTMFNTTATNSNILYYSAKDKNGNYLEQSTWPNVGANINDGNWHKVSQYVKFSTSEMYLWVDVEEPTLSNYTFYRNYTDSAWSGADLYYLSFTLADEDTYTGLWGYKEMDDLEVWNTLPVPGQEPPPVEPTCQDNPMLCADQAECEGAGWYWCDGECQASPCGSEPGTEMEPVRSRGKAGKGIYMR